MYPIKLNHVKFTQVIVILQNKCLLIKFSIINLILSRFFKHIELVQDV